MILRGFDSVVIIEGSVEDEANPTAVDSGAAGRTAMATNCLDSVLGFTAAELNAAQGWKIEDSHPMAYQPIRA